MPLLTLHLLRLHPSSLPLSSFLTRLAGTPDVSIVLASKPQHIVVHPTALDVSALTAEPWDVLLLLQTPSAALPDAFRAAVAAEYKLCAGIPSKLLASYPQHDAELRRQRPKTTGSLDRALRERDVRGGQKLELSEDLLGFLKEMESRRGGADQRMTMLNLLHFQEGGKGSYYKYGQGFKTVAASRGGDAKIVGNVVAPPKGAEKDSRGDPERKPETWWNEMSLVHYPSIRSFCDMLAGDDYQDINSRHRLGALKDTFLLATTETLLDSGSTQSKL